MSYSTGDHSATTESTRSTEGVIEASRHRLGQLVASHPVATRLLYAELALLSLGTVLSFVNVGVNPNGTSIPEVFATLSFVTAMVVAVAAVVGGVGVAAYGGYRTVKNWAA